MASYRKRKNKWQAQIRRKGHNPVSKSFTHKRDAQRWALEIELQIERGSYQDSYKTQQTELRAVLERYGAEVSPTKACVVSDRSRIKHLVRHMGHRTLGLLNRTDLADYRDLRLKQVSSQSVRAELSLLNRILVKADQEWGFELPHGIPKVQSPKVPRGRERRLEAGELQKLLNALSASPKVGAIAEFAIETAMRRGEICKMDWTDINWQRRTLNIPETKTDVPREIPLSGVAVAILRGLDAGKCSAGPVWDVRPHSVSQAFNRACKRAGLDDLRFHDLRHEAASRLFEAGLSIMEVASITGHQSPAMLSRYTHLRAEDLVAKLNR